MTQQVSPAVSTVKDVLWPFVFVIASVIGIFQSTNVSGQLLSYLIFFVSSCSFLFHFYAYITKRGVSDEVAQDKAASEQAAE
jgi:hypothetical protein